MRITVENNLWIKLNQNLFTKPNTNIWQIDIFYRRLDSQKPTDKYILTVPPSLSAMCQPQVNLSILLNRTHSPKKKYNIKHHLQISNMKNQLIKILTKRLFCTDVPLVNYPLTDKNPLISPQEMKGGSRYLDRLLKFVTFMLYEEW